MDGTIYLQNLIFLEFDPQKHFVCAVGYLFLIVFRFAAYKLPRLRHDPVELVRQGLAYVMFDPIAGDWTGPDLNISLASGHPIAETLKAVYASSRSPVSLRFSDKVVMDFIYISQSI